MTPSATVMAIVTLVASAFKPGQSDNAFSLTLSLPMETTNY
jgi:hypothetical protein